MSNEAYLKLYAEESFQIPSHNLCVRTKNAEAEDCQVSTDYMLYCRLIKNACRK